MDESGARAKPSGISRALAGASVFRAVDVKRHATDGLFLSVDRFDQSVEGFDESSARKRQRVVSRGRSTAGWVPVLAGYRKAVDSFAHTTAGKPLPLVFSSPARDRFCPKADRSSESVAGKRHASDCFVLSVDCFDESVDRKRHATDSLKQSLPAFFLPLVATLRIPA